MAKVPRHCGDKLLHVWHLILTPSGVDVETVPLRKMKSGPAGNPHEANVHEGEDYEGRTRQNGEVAMRDTPRAPLGEKPEIFSSNAEGREVQDKYKTEKSARVESEEQGRRKESGASKKAPAGEVAQEHAKDRMEAKQKPYTHEQLRREFEVDYWKAGLLFGRRLAAELIGTFLLTLFHGMAKAESTTHLISDEAAATAAGLTLVLLIYSLGEISGAHFNPCVTAAFTIRLAFPVMWLPWYWVAQLIGSILAGAVIRGIFHHEAPAATSAINPNFGLPIAFGVETLLSFLLIFVILNIAARSSVVGFNAALAVGSTIALNVFIGGKISSASMNPFRSLGCYIVNGPADPEIWVFVVAPFVGMLIASLCSWILNGCSFNSQTLLAAQGSVKD